MVNRSSEGVASTYACGNCCPNTLESIEVDPFGTLSELGLDTPFTAFQSERSCNNTLFGPYEASPDSWASSNTIVATMLLSTAHAEGVGLTDIQACSTRFLWYNSGLGGDCQYITDQMCNAGSKKPPLQFIRLLKPLRRRPMPVHHRPNVQRGVEKTAFAIYSTTKTFTGRATIVLFEEGKISLVEPIFY